MSITKKLFSYFFIIFTIALIVNLSKNVWRLLHADERIDEAEDKLGLLEAENKELKENFEYFKSEDYKEAEIRNKLQMAKPGEAVVILPEKMESYSSTTTAALFNNENKKELKNWEKWIQLFI